MSAGVSHDSPRAITCTFEGPGITPPNFHETTLKRGREDENSGGRGKKRAKFWVALRRGVRRRGCWFHEDQQNLGPSGLTKSVFFKVPQ